MAATPSDNAAGHHAKVADDEVPAFRSQQPFPWLELIRFDYRARSPVTKRSFLVTPAAPLPLPQWLSGVILFQYRNDVLAASVADGLDIGTGLHRFELGAPLSMSLDDDLRLDVDLRAIYASELDAHRASGWYPSVRIGPQWDMGGGLSLGAAVFWSRGGIGFIPVPLGSIYWRPDDLPIRIDAVLPRYVEVAYRPADRFELFSTFHWESHVWAVEGGANDTTTGFLVRQEVRLQAGLRFTAIGPIGVEVSTQWVPVQAFDFDSRQGTTYTELDDFSATVSIVLDTLQ